LIVLDEPLNGVDPVGRLELTSLFRDLSARGKAILISTHLLDEMDTLADRILFICRGRILASGSLEEIRAMLDDHPSKIRITSSRTRELATRLLALDMVQAAELSGSDELHLQVHRAKQFFGALAEVVTQEDFEIERLQVSDASTEAVFDYLMKSANHPR
jgi:ABC-2 type transport system ATP-binding protein